MVMKSSPAQIQTAQDHSKSVWEKTSRSVSPELEKNFDPFCAQLLANRGKTSVRAAEKFLNPKYEHVRRFGGGVPLKDLDVATNIILRAIRAKKKIVLFGDYDVDGISGSALLYDVLQQLGANVMTILPHRERDGYGLQVGSIPTIEAAKANLVITVDNGIVSHEAVEALRQKAIEVVIVDHHEPNATLPGANAVLNPKRADEISEFRKLCAAGVAFRLAESLLSESGVKDGQEKWLLDLVALATVCDMMPLEGENRTFVRFGLLTLAKTRRKGLAQLLENSGARNARNSKVVDVEALGFRLGPRLNAAGRLEHAQRALDLLISNDAHLIQEHAEWLEKLNRERQTLTKHVVSGARQAALHQLNQPALVLTNPGWPKGVCGLAAGKLTREFNRPIFVLEEGDLYTGSGRGVEGIDLAAIIHAKPELFERAGGHAAAAGCTLKREHLDAFRDHLVSSVRAIRGDTVPPPTLKFEADIALAEINLALVDTLKQFEPFGMGNPKPLVRLTNCRIESLRPIGGDGSHAALRISQGTARRRAVAFSMYQRIAQLGATSLDFLAQVRENTWQGTTTAELEIIDVAKHDANT